MTKKENMKTKTDQELATFIAEMRETLRLERFAAAGARPKDSASPGKLRKAIARAETERRSRALAA